MLTVRVHRNRRRRGLSFVAAAFFVVTAAAFASLAIGTTAASWESTRSRVETQRAYYVAEGGLDFALSQLSVQAWWAARDTAEFPEVLPDGSFRGRWRTFGAEGGRFQVRVSYVRENPVPAGWTGPGLPAGFEPFVTVTYPDRGTDRPKFDCVLLEVTGENGRSRKTMRGKARLEIPGYGSAIVMDATTPPGSGGGKSYALNFRAVVVRGTNQFVYGGIRSNGAVVSSSSNHPLTTSNASETFAGFTGAIGSNLLGTGNQIPDYTNPGSPDQLFDFARFKAAATAGRGQVYTSLASFQAAMNAANANGVPLEGITYLLLDCDAEGGSPKIDTTDIPGGINIKGTLVFDFVDPPDKYYKVFGECAIRINAPVLRADFDPADPATFTTGYPPVINASKDPRGFDLTPYGFESFEADDDLPALMYQTGTIDIHREALICGAVYGPSFVEIENKHDALQYFNGMLVAGAGAYLDAGEESGAAQVFVFDSSSIDRLATAGHVVRTATLEASFASD